MTFTIDGRVFVGLGFDGANDKSDLWEYLPTSDTWVQRASYGGGGLDVATAFAIEGKGYAGMGLKSGQNFGYYPMFWEYDPQSDSWSQKADFPGSLRGGSVGFALNGAGYLGTGGTASQFGSERFDDFWRYDPILDEWVQLSDFGGAPRTAAVSYKVNGRIYVGCGGGIGGTLSDVWVLCGSEPYDELDSVTLAIKVYLEGPYESTKLMNDDLRVAGLVPLTSPYTSFGWPAPLVPMTEVPLAPAVLTVTGADAIVDWVRVELRRTGDSATVYAAFDAVLDREGDIVSPADGFSPLTMVVPEGDYYVAIRHRNHLGFMAAIPFSTSDGALIVDFRDAAVPTWGTEGLKAFDGSQMMWAGDARPDDRLKYTGTDNDRDAVLQRIGGVLPTAASAGYFDEDVNLDGEVKYTGADNDRDPILQNIGGVVPTNTRVEQLP